MFLSPALPAPFLSPSASSRQDVKESESASGAWVSEQAPRWPGHIRQVVFLRQEGRWLLFFSTGCANRETAPQMLTPEGGRAGVSVSCSLQACRSTSEDVGKSSRPRKSAQPILSVKQWKTMGLRKGRTLFRLTFLGQRGRLLGPDRPLPKSRADARAGDTHRQSHSKAKASCSG